jgi:hypothetical protein
MTSPRSLQPDTIFLHNHQNKNRHPSILEMSVPVTGKSGGKDTRAQALQDEFEKRPDPIALTQNPDPSKNSSSGVDYEPYPEKSIPLEPAHEKIVQAICNLYSGSASKEDMMVYAEEAIYDDPWSYCDTRYKIAGQWYGEYTERHELLLLVEATDIHISGIPKIMKTTRTIKTQVVSSKPDEIIFKLQQEYTPKPMPIAKKVNSLVTLTLDKEGKVKYHKVCFGSVRLCKRVLTLFSLTQDMWNEKDYSHEGLGKIMKELNGDYLTKITQPPEDL